MQGHRAVRPLHRLTPTLTVIPTPTPTPSLSLSLTLTLARYIYCTFFTLAGGSVKFDPRVLRAAMVLVLVRFLGVCVGSVLGGIASPSPSPSPSPNPNPNQVLGGIAAREDRKHYRIGWMSYITQVSRRQ